MIRSNGSRYLRSVPKRQDGLFGRLKSKHVAVLLVLPSTGGVPSAETANSFRFAVCEIAWALQVVVVLHVSS